MGNEWGGEEKGLCMLLRGFTYWLCEVLVYNIVIILCSVASSLKSVCYLAYPLYSVQSPYEIVC